MKPGSLVRIKKFDKDFLFGIYLGPSNRIVPRKKPYLCSFLSSGGSIVDIDIGNILVYYTEVLK